MTTLLVHRARSTEVGVQARTVQAAARKVFGRSASLGTTRLTSAGALEQTEVTVSGRFAGFVDRPIDPTVRLVHYPHRTSVAPFWAIPSEWLDGETNPIAEVNFAAARL